VEDSFLPYRISQQDMLLWLSITFLCSIMLFALYIPLMRFFRWEFAFLQARPLEQRNSIDP